MRSVGYYASKVPLQYYWNALLIVLALAELVCFLMEFDEEKNDDVLLLRFASSFFNAAWIVESVVRSFRAGSNTTFATEELRLKELYRRRCNVVVEAAKTDTARAKQRLEEETRRGEEEERRRGRYYLEVFVVSFIATLLLYSTMLPLSVVEGLLPEGFAAWLDDDDEDSASRYSLGFLLACKVSDRFRRRARAKAVATTKRVAVRTTRFAVRNPRAFRRRLNTALTAARWIKYLGPLVGGLNKLKGNAGDLMIKLRQYREARAFKRIREQMWRNMTPEQRLEHATLRIQSQFRARRARKNMHALRIFTLNSFVFHVIKIQVAMRRKAAHARLVLRVKRNELNELERRHFGYRQGVGGRSLLTAYVGRPSDLTLSEKMRMMELREQLRKAEKKETTYKMLLRPNTTFAVAWKLLFVFTILIEIVQVVATQRSNNASKGGGGDKLTLEEILSSWLLPPPECLPKPPEPPKHGLARLLEQCGNFLRSLFPPPRETDATTSAQTAAVVLSSTARGRFGRRKRSVCDPLSPWETIYVGILHEIIRHFSTAVATIMFLDVFVTFFTGEINPNNGVLQPKAFFPRWILPGVLIQILLNPTMKNTADNVRAAAAFVGRVGPSRFARWFIVLSPWVLRIVYAAVNYWGTYYVARENKKATNKTNKPSLFP